MRRHWIAVAALALVPFALMAVSPPVETSSTETSTPAVETPAVETAAETSPPADLEALKDTLFLPGAEEVSNHCCSPAAQQACEDACRPDPGFTACSGNTCFCICVTIN